MWWGCYGLCLTQANRVCPLLFILFLCLFCLYDPFNCISFLKFSRQLRFLTLFFRSYFCLIGPFNYMSLYESLLQHCPRRLTFTWWGCSGLCLWHKPAELAHSFSFCSCIYFCLYGPFNCISFHKFFRQLSAFSVCSFGLISALLVLSTIFLFMKVSFCPDIIPSGWLGLKHQLTSKILGRSVSS